MACFYNQNGKIVCTLSGTDETIALNKSQQELLGNRFYPESLLESEYYFANDKPVLKPTRPDENSFFDYSTKTWVLNPDFVAVKVINQRNLELDKSDWTDTVSAQTRLGAKYQAWQDYRQALRDVPQQSGFPLSIEWPLPPS